MIIQFHKNFDKKFLKHKKMIRDKFKERLVLFKNNPFHPPLNNHPLKGKLRGSRSINVTGNYRAIFIYETNDLVVFVDIDTHPKLYY